MSRKIIVSNDKSQTLECLRSARSFYRPSASPHNNLTPTSAAINLHDLRSRTRSYSALNYSPKPFATFPSRQASTSLKTIRTGHAISVRKLLNNITVNLPRLVGIMIAPPDNLLLIIPAACSRIRMCLSGADN